MFFICTIAEFPDGSNLGILIIFTIYFLILFVVSVCLIHSPHCTNKSLFFGTIYSVAYIAFVSISSLILFSFGSEFVPENGEWFFYISTLTLSSIISGLYFYAAFKKDSK